LKDGGSGEETIVGGIGSRKRKRIITKGIGEGGEGRKRESISGFRK